MESKFSERVKRPIKSFRAKPTWFQLLVVGIGVVFLGRLLGVGPFETRQPEPEPIRVEEVEEAISASGELQAGQRVLLHFQTTGRLAWLGVSEGDRVSKGQVIASLDTTKVKASLEQAEADLRSAQATLDRVLDEVKGHEEDENFEQREERTIAEVARDKAYWAKVKAEKDLADATLISPFVGIVTDISSLVVGQNVSLTDSIEIVGTGEFFFRALLDEIDYQGVRIGQKAEVFLDAFPDEVFTGEVVFISRSTTTTRSGITAIPVKIKIPADERFIHGLNGDVEFLLD